MRAMISDPPAPALPTIGWIDEPASEAIVGPDLRLTGWALAASRIRAVEIEIEACDLNAGLCERGRSLGALAGGRTGQNGGVSLGVHV